MDDEFVALFSPTLDGWRMAGEGGFFRTEDGVLESRGGSGLFWYAMAVFDDFVLRVSWRVLDAADNSGVFLRIPALAAGDVAPAVAHGYEVQIDERGVDPETGFPGSPLHLTGAVYGVAPARRHASRAIGEWNSFDITAKKDTILVSLNGELVARCDAGGRAQRGHLALQAHHDGSRVQFRDLRVKRL